jgi:diaminopimelate decarboxylase
MDPSAVTAPSAPLTQQLLAQNFQRSDGQLVLDGCRLTDLAETYGTPLFVYSEQILQRTWQQLRQTFPAEFAIYYSIKANPHQALLRFFLSRGCGLEVASGGELQQALVAGAAAGRLVYAGPGKTDAELTLAIQQEVSELHAESWGEVQRIARIARSLGRRAPVALRVNPNLATVGGSLQMGGRPSQFGIDEDQLPEVVSAAQREAAVELRGLHLNTGTQILQAEMLLEYYRHAALVARRTAAQLQRPLQTLDLGGGLGIPYHAGQTPLDLDRLHAGLVELLDECRQDPWLGSTCWLIEPGRYLVGEAGCYLMRVVDIKRSRGQTFVITDGGMHHHAAATGNFGQTLKRPFPIAVGNRQRPSSDEVVAVVGPLCTPLDSFGRQLPLAGLQVGDLLVVLQSGAYARAASPLQFLGHDSPAEVWVDRGRHRLIRRRGSWRDALCDQIE